MNVVEFYNSGLFPDAGRPLLALTNNHKFMTIKDSKDKKTWAWYVSKYSIVAWNFQDEIRVVW